MPALALAAAVVATGAVSAPVHAVEDCTQATNPAIEIEDAATVDPEGAAGTTATATFPVTLTEPTNVPVTVSYTTVAATASAQPSATGLPADYETAGGTLTIPACEIGGLVEVTVRGDDNDEDDETFQVHLSAPQGGHVLDGIGIATIADDDPPPVLSVSDPTAVESTGANRFLVFSVALSAPSGKIVTVGYATAGGPDGPAGAKAPADYKHREGTLSFTGGLQSQTVSVEVVADTLDELDETFALVLQHAPTNATISATDGIGIGTITDDDGPAITIDDPVVAAEGAAGQTTTATFTIKLEAISPQPVSVAAASANETATAPEDFQPLAAGTRVTIPPGQDRATVAVTVNGDDLDEADEKLRVTISAATGGTITDTSGSATITDDDAPPVLRVEDVQVPEGTGGTSEATFRLALDRASGRSVLIGYTTKDETALAGADYQQVSELVTISPGELSKEVKVPIAPDGALEDDETFTLLTFGGTNTTVDKGTATATILDDDLNAGNMPSLRIADARLRREGGPGERATLSFAVSASAALPRTFSVRYATRDGSATAGADYEPIAGVLTFAPGETAKTLAVVVYGDAAVEFNHAFTVELSDPVHARVADGSGLGTIVDDDVGGGPVTVPRTIDASRVLCRRGRPCTGLPVRWRVALAGTIRIDLAIVAR